MIIPCDEGGLLKAAEVIKNGGLLVYPTETVYGLGCNALDEAAVKRIFKVKKRPRDQPLSIAVSSLSMLRRYSRIDERCLRVVERFFPGPVTLVVPNKGLPDILTGGRDSIGIRIPNHKASLRLINLAGVPLVSTSANVSGKKPPKSARGAADQLEGVDLILDGGLTPGEPSTIIDLCAPKPLILRKGKKPIWEILPVLEEIYGPL